MGESIENSETPPGGVKEITAKGRELVEKVLGDDNFHEIEQRLVLVLGNKKNKGKESAIRSELDAVFTEWLAYHFLKDQLEEGEVLTSPKEFEQLMLRSFSKAVKYSHYLRRQVNREHPDGIVFKEEGGNRIPVALCEYSLTAKPSSAAPHKRRQIRHMLSGLLTSRLSPIVKSTDQALRAILILPKKEDGEEYDLVETNENKYKGRMPLSSGQIRSVSEGIFSEAFERAKGD